ncbi:MFS transporter [Fructilactobacillus carniphilus]|uniref:MFS transporter n=1 Tax=Fructilactobacillus carniphilus TaxID=2940297 RepID=A0ABY5BUU3_9LACO|nr:MFS transporter [Fructilactobacillus carniphilus]USS90279.1 MFS transporter [Fructilactobacillus carniphilus]
MSTNQKLVLFAASSGFGLENMDVLFLSFTLSSIIATMHISPGAAGMIGTITNWGMLLGGIIFGMLGDRLIRVKVFTNTIFVFALATALMSIAKNIYWIYLFRLLAGIGAGGEYGIGITLIAEAFPNRNLGKLSSIATIGAQIGAVAAAILATLVIPHFGWHALYLFGLLSIVLIFLVRRHLKESSTFLANKRNQTMSPFTAIRRYMFTDGKTNWTTIGLLLIIGAVVGFFSNGMYGGYGAVVSQLYPITVRSSANNMIVGVGRALGGMSSLVIGLLMEHFNLIVVMMFLSVLYLISFVTMLSLPNLNRKNYDYR